MPGGGRERERESKREREGGHYSLLCAADLLLSHGGPLKSNLNTSRFGLTDLGEVSSHNRLFIPNLASLSGYGKK